MYTFYIKLGRIEWNYDVLIISKMIIKIPSLICVLAKERVEYTWETSDTRKLPTLSKCCGSSLGHLTLFFCQGDKVTMTIPELWVHYSCGIIYGPHFTCGRLMVSNMSIFSYVTPPVIFCSPGVVLT